VDPSLSDFRTFGVADCRDVSSLEAKGQAVGRPYSHSIVPGGFEVTSVTTRLTPLNSLMMRVAAQQERPGRPLRSY
jgi:hypothetical protein